MSQNLAAGSPRERRTFFAVKEIHTYEGYDGRDVSDEYVVTVDDNSDELALFASEANATEWMAERGFRTSDQVRSAHLETLKAQYSKDIRQYEKDLAEVEKMRAAGVPTRLHPKLSRPSEPAISKFWVPSSYYEIVPASVVG